MMQGARYLSGDEQRLLVQLAAGHNNPAALLGPHVSQLEPTAQLQATEMMHQANRRNPTAESLRYSDLGSLNYEQQNEIYLAITREDLNLLEETQNLGHFLAQNVNPLLRNSARNELVRVINIPAGVFDAESIRAQAFLALARGNELGAVSQQFIDNTLLQLQQDPGAVSPITIEATIIGMDRRAFDEQQADTIVDAITRHPNLTHRAEMIGRLGPIMANLTDGQRTSVANAIENLSTRGLIGTNPDQARAHQENFARMVPRTPLIRGLEGINLMAGLQHFTRSDRDRIGFAIAGLQGSPFVSVLRAALPQWEHIPAERQREIVDRASTLADSAHRAEALSILQDAGVGFRIATGVR